MKKKTKKESAPPAPSAIRRHREIAAALALLVLLVAGLLWMLAGQMMRLGAIPSLDLGYDWFNAHIYPFF